MKLDLCLAAALLTFAPPLVAQESAPKSPRSITIDDFFQIRDVSQPELSPDGQWVAYAVRARLLKDDKSEQRLFMVSTHGGDPIPLTAEAVSSSHPRWSPDGKYFSFLSARNGAQNQVWLLDRRGGEAQRLTDVAQGVTDFEWSPDSTRVVLILQDPKPEDAESAKDKDKEKPDWNSDAFYQRQLENVWADYHDKDIPETNFDWQSWNKQERSWEDTKQ